MSFRKQLICVGAGLALTACGGGGGDGLSGSSYNNDIVVRVVFEDLAAFRNVAAETGDLSDVRITFDIDVSNTINAGDISFYYKLQYSEGGYQEAVQLQQYEVGRYVTLSNDVMTVTFTGNTLEWVLDRADLAVLLGESDHGLTASIGVNVVASKSVSLTDSSDFIPDLATVEVTDPNGRIVDDTDDWMPSDGPSAVDLSSVRVLFFD